MDLKNNEDLVTNCIIQGVSGSAPPVVVAGYTFYVDAGNSSSYSGSGSTWFDLSADHNDATLVGAPTFDPVDGGGNFAMSGGNTQYATFDYSSDFNLNGVDSTIEAWVKFSTFSGGQIVISKDRNGAYFDWCIYVPNSSTIGNYTAGTGLNYSASTSLSAGVWYYISITNISNTAHIYLNAVEQGTGGGLSLTNNVDFGPAGTLGIASFNVPNTGLIAAELSIVRVYKGLGLTSTQVTQNFDAQKTRFGY